MSHEKPHVFFSDCFLFMTIYYHDCITNNFFLSCQKAITFISRYNIKGFGKPTLQQVQKIKG